MLQDLVLARSMLGHSRPDLARHASLQCAASRVRESFGDACRFPINWISDRIKGFAEGMNPAELKKA